MMKKILALGTMGIFVAMACVVEAAPRGKGQCSYSPLQEFIRTIRSEEQIHQLIEKGIDLNAKTKCGGSILQLAIRRGNPQVVKALLEAKVDFESPVSLEGFQIQGAPKEVPLLMFAAYYAPRPDIFRLFISAGSDVTELDANGENVLWYMRQNPVLNDTELYDEVNAILLYQTAKKKTVLEDEDGAAESKKQTEKVTKTDSPSQKTSSNREQRRRVKEIVEPELPVEEAEKQMQDSDF